MFGFKRILKKKNIFLLLFTFVQEMISSFAIAGNTMYFLPKIDVSVLKFCSWNTRS